MIDTLETRVQRLLAGDRDMLGDPFPTWAELRETRPVCRTGPAVILNRHGNAQELLGDKDLFDSRNGTRASYQRAQESFGVEGRRALERVFDHEFHQFVRMDPPDYLSNRKVATSPFAARSLAPDMREKTDARVERSLGRIGAAGGIVDFKQFAYALPLDVLGAVADRRTVTWSHTRRQGHDGADDVRRTRDHQQPPDDRHVRNAALPGTMARAVCRRGAAAQRRRATAPFRDAAWFVRYLAQSPRELEHGKMEAGDTMIGVAARNRDPSAFEPRDELDLRREDGRQHIALGMGRHVCLGAGLARMEATAVFGQLTCRFPWLELVDHDLDWGGRSLRTPLNMRVRLHLLPALWTLLLH